MKKTVAVLAFVAGLLAGSASAATTHTAATIDTRADVLMDELPEGTPVKPMIDDDGQLVIVLSTNITGSLTIPADLGSVTLDLNGWSIVGTNGVDGTETTFGGNGGAAIIIAGSSGADAGTTAITVRNEPSTQLWENGPYFASCNVGATEPQQSGYFFWWGDTVGYTNNGSAWISVKDGTTSITFNDNPPANSTYNKNAAELQSAGYIDDVSNPFLNAAHDAATANLGAPWRLMTSDELAKLTDTTFCTREWKVDYKGTGVNGYLVKGAVAPYTNNEVFFPVAGYGKNSDFFDGGTVGLIWCSTLYSDNPAKTFYLRFDSDQFSQSNNDRSIGMTVRAVNSDGTRPPTGAGPAEAVGGNGGYGCGKGGEPIVGADGKPYPVEGGSVFLKKGTDGKGAVSIVSDEKDGLAFDTRTDAVRKPATLDEILPFAWNDDEAWPTDGTGVGVASVSVVPMGGEDKTDPVAWTNAGPVRTFVTASGEGTNAWNRQYAKLYQATITHRAGETEVAYFDLTDLNLPTDPVDVLKEEFGEGVEITLDANGDPTVILDRDITDGVTLPTDLGSITIDLNGWSIKGVDGADGTTTSAAGNGGVAITVDGACGAEAGDTAITLKDERPDGVQLWENGPYFATCNVGATKPEESGYFFWWGDTVGYTNNGSAWISVKDSTTSILFDKSTPANTTYNRDTTWLTDNGWIGEDGNLLASNDAARVHLSGDWRMPTEAELMALCEKCDNFWQTRNGVPGRIVCGKGDYASKEIFLPAIGVGRGSTQESVESSSQFWSSTPHATYESEARNLRIDQSAKISVVNGSRYEGYQVRAVRDPDGSRPTPGPGPAEVVGGKGGDGNPAGKGSLAIVDGTGAAYSEITDPSGLVTKGADGTTLLPDVTAETEFTYDGTEKRPVVATNVFEFAGDICATNAGDYTVSITPAAGFAWGDGSTATTNIAWTIAPRAVTLTSGTEQFTYNGRAHSNVTVTVTGDGFIAGEGVATNDFATITDAGTADNTFAYEPVGETLLANYDISVVTGVLTVVKSGA